MTQLFKNMDELSWFLNPFKTSFLVIFNIRFNKECIFDVELNLSNE